MLRPALFCTIIYMLNSFFLSLFFFAFLIISILAYRRFDPKLLSIGSAIRLSRRTLVFFFLADILVAVGVGYLFIYHSNPVLLEYFYGVLYYLSAVIGCFLLIQQKSLKRRIIAALCLPIPFFALTILTRWQMLQNIVTAGSIIWVGIFLFKRFRIPQKCFIAGLIIATLIDAYNVWLAPASSGLFSDVSLLFNGNIVFGSASLGIGDFFLGYLIVAAFIYYRNVRQAIIIAFIIAFARFILRAIIPAFAGVAIPYYVIIVPLSLLALWLSRAKSPPAPDIQTSR